ncbi:MAG: DUF1929 domain-containing protein [Chitinophagaceae bacterium]|nr:DUF1929 domain-containing protein [Oligoflexus sp.]
MWLRLWLASSLLICALNVEAQIVGDLQDGQIFSIESQGNVPGSKWLIANNDAGEVRLVTTNTSDRTAWKLHPQGDRLYTLEAIAPFKGPHWLSVNDQKQIILDNSDFLPATRWLITPDGAGGFTLKNSTLNTGNIYLDSYTTTGGVGLAASTAEGFSGTHWKFYKPTTLTGAFQEGQVISLENVSSLTGNRFIDGSPANGNAFLSQTNAGAGAKWKLHAYGDNFYTLESMTADPGLRFLGVNSAGLIKLQDTDASETARWSIVVDSAGGYVVKNAGITGTVNCLSGIPETSALALAPLNTSTTSSTHWRISLGSVANALITHGDVISLRSLGNIEGLRYMSGATTNGAVTLAFTYDSVLSETFWRIHDNQDSSFSLEGLGTTPGPRWLRVANNAVNMGSTTDRGEATRWQFFRDVNGNAIIRNISIGGTNVWLDGYTTTGAVGLAPATTAAYSGTHWQVIKHRSLNAAVAGRWSSVDAVPQPPIHSHVLADGRVLAWSRFSQANDASTADGVPIGGATTFIYDPKNGSITTAPNAANDPFCSSHTLLPNGTLFVNGGHIDNYVGKRSTQIFTPATNTWSTNPAWDMARGRWYPSSTMLPNGEILTLTGADAGPGQNARTPEVWSPITQNWRSLTNLTDSCLNNGTGACQPLYPWLHLASNGRVFLSGPGEQTGYIDSAANGAYTPLAATTKGFRGEFEGSSILYAPDKVMNLGGLPITNHAEVIDLTAPTPTWRVVPGMLSPRHRFATVLLADGTVFAVGGVATNGGNDADSSFASEIWNPTTELWGEADHIRIPRLYHSTAVLLQDGRVLAGGGGIGGYYTKHSNIQIYWPPYLYKGNRPKIISAPSTAIYNTSFAISTADAERITRVNLIRNPSQTHGVNSGHHIVTPTFTVMRGRITLQIPGRNQMPPGVYMVFIVDNRGVPSISKTLTIQ